MALSDSIKAKMMHGKRARLNEDQYPANRRQMRILFASTRMILEIWTSLYHTWLRRVGPIFAVGLFIVVLILAKMELSHYIFLGLGLIALSALALTLIYYYFFWDIVSASLQDRLKNQGENFKSRTKYYRRLRKKLEILQEPSEDAHSSYVVIREFQFTTHFSYMKAKIGRFSRLDGFRAIRIATLLSSLQAQTAKKGRSEEFYKDYITTFREKRDFEKTMLWDGGDMSLRFRQSSPELPFYAGANAIEQVQPRYVVIDCLMNPIRDPVFVLMVSDIIEKLPEAIREICNIEPGDPDDSKKIDEIVERVNSTPFYKYDNYDRYSLVREDSEVPFPIGNNIDLDRPWLGELSWDINKVIIEREPVYEKQRQVLSIVSRAIYLAQFEAREIVLRTGDTMVIDNRRALHCRKEFDYPKLRFKNRRIPIVGHNRRWLRLYYGFEKEPSRIGSGIRLPDQETLEDEGGEVEAGELH